MVICWQHKHVYLFVGSIEKIWCDSVIGRYISLMRLKFDLHCARIFINVQNAFFLLQVEDKAQHRHCIREDGTVQWCVFQIWGHHARKTRLCLRWSPQCCVFLFFTKMFFTCFNSKIKLMFHCFRSSHDCLLLCTGWKG